MGFTTKSPARLWVLLAREAPVGVIFRRGPSKQVLLIRWDMRRDRFETGQWFKGRVYERRCDLSPDGKLLIYFATNHKRPLYSWTAISKPPFFTALALWEKGDCWNGGGWFVGNRKIRLNHSDLETKLQPGFHLGPIKVVGLADSYGEDSTVRDVVMERDGWTLGSRGKMKFRGLAKGWASDPPAQFTKAHPTKKDLALEMSIIGIGGDEGTPWYQINYRLLSGSDEIADLGIIDWADWDHRGDLVFAKAGRLFRQRVARSLSAAPVQIADFNGRKFENVPPPAEAQRW